MKNFVLILFQPGFEDESFFQTPFIRYCAVSSIEHSHSEPISDLQWVPDHFQVEKKKSSKEHLTFSMSFFRSRLKVYQRKI